MADAGLSRATRKNMLHTLASVLEAAAEWGYLQTRNPCKRIKVGDGLEVYERRALSPEDARRLVQCCEEPLKTVCEIALYTGLRAAEILGLTWGAIDFTARTITVKQSKSEDGELSSPKTSAGRRKVALGALVARLKRPAAATDLRLVFADGDYKTLQMRLKRRAAKLGLNFRGFGFHTFRRTYATLRDTLEHSKANAAMAAAMGHTNPSMSEHYISGAILTCLTKSWNW